MSNTYTLIYPSLHKQHSQLHFYIQIDSYYQQQLFLLSHQELMGNNNELPDLSGQVIPVKAKGCCDKMSLYLSQGNADPSDITCPICFRIFANPRLMKCKHKYCQQCITTWGKGSTASCPFCRIDLKRQRGTFGRIDKKTQKKIEKLTLKCRNCCWEGSYFMFLTTFQLQPYLDDGELPADNNECEQDESCQNQIREEKEEKREFQKTASKQREQEKEKQQECKKQVQMIDKQQTKKALQLFASTLLQMAQSGQLDVSHLI